MSALLRAATAALTALGDSLETSPGPLEPDALTALAQAQARVDSLLAPLKRDQTQLRPLKRRLVAVPLQPAVGLLSALNEELQEAVLVWCEPKSLCHLEQVSVML